ncbi:hypothetical protein OG417_48275 [Actinoallomurus sp. NBC_01490]|uniref:hypothetical protein n=1 Tax=Actinoallomurus sp. NBC_01490 TaxID=2903557 RepID=UPI002E2F8EF3|nr:hypothetical protein [Actinoallomurus sp. NBC_01490]
MSYDHGGHWSPAAAKARGSYDHGGHWSPAAAKARGDGAFEAFVRHPATATGAVSLRVQAADAAGDTVTQTVYDAYGLKHSGGR